jgi:hypothetical protein
LTVTAGGTFSQIATVSLNTVPGTYSVVVSAYVPGFAQPQVHSCSLATVNRGIALVASAQSASIGTRIVVAGGGFLAGEPITVALQYTGSGLAGANIPGTAIAVTADPMGSFTIGYTVASTVNALVPGSYYLSAGDTQTGFFAAMQFDVTAPQPVNNSVLTCPTTPLLAGQQFQISGTNFAAGTGGTLAVNFNPTPVSMPISIRVDGTFYALPIVPLDATPGAYTVLVTASVPGFGQPQQATCSLTVIANAINLMVSASSGPIGSTVVVTATGFAAAEPVRIALQYTSVGLAGTNIAGTVLDVTADGYGTISTIYTVASSVHALVPGSYNLYVGDWQRGYFKTVPFVVTP